MAKRRSSNSSTLRISRKQYRAFSEITKAVGLGLNLSTAKEMGCWGSYSPWALLICKDASDPNTQWEERSLITLARSINADELRAAGAGRPELDWAALEDEEIYPFVVWHEIGHRMDNFDTWGVMTLQDLEVRNKCHGHIKFMNEVLADRYAWERIRPGEPIPLSENGKLLQEKTAEIMKYMTTHAPRMNSLKVRSLEQGQYKDVPSYMLTTPERAAFIGPKVNKQVIERSAACHRK